MQRTAAVDEVLLLLEFLAADAVPPLVNAFVDVARVVEAPRQFGDAGMVTRFGGADEVVERHLEPLPGAAEFLLHPIAVRPRIESGLDRLLVDVLRVLVVAHQKARVEPAQPLVAGDDVGADLLVRRPEVRPAVDVIDGRGQKEALHACFSP